MAVAGSEGAAPHVVVVARLDLQAPGSPRGWCRVRAASGARPAPPHAALTRREPEATGLILRSARRRNVLVARGEETILEGEAPAAIALDGRMHGDERVILIDPEVRARAPLLSAGPPVALDNARSPASEAPRVWQLPALAPKLRVLAPGGAHELVELRCETVEVDLDRGEISLFWRGRTRSSSGLAGLGDERLEVDGGFVLGASAAAIATALEGPPRSPLSAVPIAGDTRFEAATFPWPVSASKEVLVVVVKGTFELVEGGAARLAAEQAPLSGERLHDGGGSLAYPGDFVPPKPRADVLVTGHAYPKADARVARVEVRVGPVVAGLVAMGPRAWLPGGHPGEPAPMDRIPLRWEQAFGGPGVAENPAGTGLAPGSSPPSIERADTHLRKRGDRVPPAGLGPIARDWAPRNALLGTFSRDWVTTRWPALPADLDPAFWNAAPPALTAAALHGDEAYRITSVRPGGGGVSGSLPGVGPRCLSERAGHDLSEVPLRLDTVLFDADAGRLVLVWRGAVEIGAERGALRRLVLLSEPLAAPLGAAEIQRRVEGGLGPAAVKMALPPAPLGPVLLGVRAPPRASRAQVERWLASGEGLAGRDLSGADLTGMDLSGADLSRAILRGTILDDAVLDGVKAEGLRAAGVIARRSRWLGAKLDRADLAGARLDGADLSGASLILASLADAELRGLVARHISARSAQLVRARLDGAALDEARLEKVDLSGATLDGARFVGAVLDDAKLYEALGEGLVADRASLVDARFEAARLDRASFREARASGSMWERASLEGADFASADLANAGFAGANLARARFPKVDLTGARLTAATLAGASFAGANLLRASLEGAVATGADFTGANLYKAETWRARTEGAKLAGAILKGTKLG